MTDAVDTIAEVIKVKVGKPGVGVKTICLPANQTWTVADILARANENTCGLEIRMASGPVETTQAVTDGNTVLLVKPLRGGTR